MMASDKDAELAANDEVAQGATTGTEPAQPAKARKKSFPFSTVRGITALLVFVVLVVGIIFKLGGGTLSSFGLGSIAAICPLGALEVSLGSKEFMLHPIILLLVTVVIVLLTGKAFCSWACPVPWVQNIIHPQKKRSEAKEMKAVEGDGALPATQEATGDDAAAYELFPDGKPQHSCHACGACEALGKVGGTRDGLNVDSRHLVLVGALGSAAVFGFPVFCLICPIGLTFALFIGVWNAFQFNEPSIALLVAAVLLVLELTVLRKWCGKFCPLGALIGLISGANKTFKPHVDDAVCLRSKGIDCHACVEVCPEQVDPHGSMIPECSKCGACIEACPAKAISMKALRLK